MNVYFKYKSSQDVYGLCNRLTRFCIVSLRILCFSNKFKVAIKKNSDFRWFFFSNCWILWSNDSRYYKSHPDFWFVRIFFSKRFSFSGIKIIYTMKNVGFCLYTNLIIIQYYLCMTFWKLCAKYFENLFVNN